jgi:hypothetical protein
MTCVSDHGGADKTDRCSAVHELYLFNHKFQLLITLEPGHKLDVAHTDATRLLRTDPKCSSLGPTVT